MTEWVTTGHGHSMYIDIHALVWHTIQSELADAHLVISISKPNLLAYV